MKDLQFSKLNEKTYPVRLEIVVSFQYRGTDNLI